MKKLLGIIFFPGIWALLVFFTLLQGAPRLIKINEGLAGLIADVLLICLLHEFGWWGIAYGIVCIIMFESREMDDEADE